MIGGTSVRAFPVAGGTPLSDLTEGTLIKIPEAGTPVEFYLACHDYESGLNGAGRVLFVRKDVYDQRQWNSSNANAWANCVLRSWLNSNYKNLFSSAVQALMGTTTYYYTPGNGSWSVTTRGDAVFSLSGTELNGSRRNCNVEGTALPIWSTLQLAYNSSGNRSFQWTRSPVTFGTSSAWAFDTIPGFGGFGVDTEIGSRPCFTLPSTTKVDDDLNLIA